MGLKRASRECLNLNIYGEVLAWSLTGMGFVAYPSSGNLKVTRALHLHVAENPVSSSSIQQSVGTVTHVPRLLIWALLYALSCGL
jgi:hypothetical protein